MFKTILKFLTKIKFNLKSTCCKMRCRVNKAESEPSSGDSENNISDDSIKNANT